MNQKYIISISNELNGMVMERGELTLQAIRLVFLYLALINPLMPEITEVAEPLSSYAIGLGVELNMQAIEKSCQLLRTYQFKFGPDSNGIPSQNCIFFSTAQLVRRKSDDTLILELKCSEEIKRHIFDLRKDYTRFNAANVFELSDLRSIRLYMLLAQYRVIKRRVIPLQDLKRYLGIDLASYSEFKRFARDVLNVCQDALKKHTDITFSYRAVGRPAKSVIFEIFPNYEYLN